MTDSTERILGQLLNEADSSQRQRADLFRQVGEVKEAVGEIKTMLAPIAISQTSMALHIKDHCVELRSINDKVQQGRGAVWALRAAWAVLIIAIPTGLYVMNSYKADLDAKVRQVERRLPGDFMGRVP